MIRRKKIVLFVVLGAVFLLVVSTAFAGTTNIAGSVTTSSPCYYDWAGWFPYHSYTFTAPVSGAYTLTVLSYTWSTAPWLYVVNSPFDDNNIETYAVSSGATPLVVTLVAGQTYATVIGPDSGAADEASCHTQQGDYTATLTWTSRAASEEEAPGVPVPGCDVLIDIPDTAVVGAFTDFSELYFAPYPGATLGGPVVMEPGKTVWVMGTDESGAFYKMLLSCDYYWVRAETIGPNYDAVWAGRPLPDEVVK